MSITKSTEQAKSTEQTKSTEQAIAVGFDGSPSSAAAVDWAAMEAHRAGAVLRIVCAVHYPGMPAGSLADAPIVPATLRDHAHQLSVEASSRAGKVVDAGSVEVQVVVGGAAEALISTSTTAQLLVVGHRGRSALASTVLGSVSFAAAAHAHCPVVVVHEETGDPGPGRRIVVGVDGSDAADRALDLAVVAATRAGAPLRIVSAWDVPVSSSPDVERVLGDVATNAVADAAERVRKLHPDVELDTAAHQGSAGAVLVRESSEASLVVVGSRGRGGFAGLVLGSVSHAVIHGCTCPVMVVRP